MKRILCYFGIHDWRSDSDYFIGIAATKEVCLFWWECKRCYKTKLKHITR